MKTSIVSAVGATILLVTGCSDAPVSYQESAYPPVGNVSVVFHFRQVPKGCRVTRHLLVSLPAQFSGMEIQQRIEGEAGSQGANLVLVGQSRQQEDDEGLQFNYFGPAEEYLFSDRWDGWKWGYDQWQEQGEWVGIGFEEWGNPKTRFEFPIMMQAAFLRCEQ